MRPSGRVRGACCSTCSTRCSRAPTAPSASIAVRAVARHLLEAGAIGAMTTHDLSLAEEEPLKSSARLVHFTESVDEQGTMRFDYRLREGIATSRNALRLMQMIGIDLIHPSAHRTRAGDPGWKGPDVGPVRDLAKLVALFTLLTVVMTWPQAATLATARAGPPGRVLQHVAVRVGRARAVHVPGAVVRRQHLLPRAAHADVFRRDAGGGSPRGPACSGPGRRPCSCTTSCCSRASCSRLPASPCLPGR